MDSIFIEKFFQKIRFGFIECANLRLVITVSQHFVKAEYAEITMSDDSFNLSKAVGELINQYLLAKIRGDVTIMRCIGITYLFQIILSCVILSDLEYLILELVRIRHAKYGSGGH